MPSWTTKLIRRQTRPLKATYLICEASVDAESQQVGEWTELQFGLESPEKRVALTGLFMQFNVPNVGRL